MVWKEESQLKPVKTKTMLNSQLNKEKYHIHQHQTKKILNVHIEENCDEYHRHSQLTHQYAIYFTNEACNTNIQTK
jgi:hypothetical protein